MPESWEIRRDFGFFFFFFSQSQFFYILAPHANALQARWTDFWIVEL